MVSPLMELSNCAVRIKALWAARNVCRGMVVFAVDRCHRMMGLRDLISGMACLLPGEDASARPAIERDLRNGHAAASILRSKTARRFVDRREFYPCSVPQILLKPASPTFTAFASRV